MTETHAISHSEEIERVAAGSWLATREVLIVYQADYFEATHIPLTCTAAL